MEAKKDHEIASLKRQAAIQITFKCKHGKPRTYLRRPGTRFINAMEELCKDLGRQVNELRFFTSFDKAKCCNTIGRDWDKTEGISEIVPGYMKTLEQVCLCLRFT